MQCSNANHTTRANFPPPRSLPSLAYILTILESCPYFAKTHSLFVKTQWTTIPRCNHCLSLPDILDTATATATQTRVTRTMSGGRDETLRIVIPTRTRTNLAVRPAVPGGSEDLGQMRIQTVTSNPERGGPQVLNSLTMSLCSRGEAAQEALKTTLDLLLPVPSQIMIQKEGLIMRVLAEALAMNQNQRDPTMRPRIGAQNMGQMIATRF